MLAGGMFLQLLVLLHRTYVLCIQTEPAQPLMVMAVHLQFLLSGALVMHTGHHYTCQLPSMRACRSRSRFQGIWHQGNDCSLHGMTLCLHVTDWQIRETEGADHEGPKASQHAEEGGFAAAVGAHDHDTPPWGDVKVELPHQGCAIRGVERHPAQHSKTVGALYFRKPALACIPLLHATSSCCQNLGQHAMDY